jgi:hypothetical protein
MPYLGITVIVPTGERHEGGRDLPETRVSDPRDCGSSDEVTPQTDKDSGRRRGPGDLARRDRYPAPPADRLHHWTLDVVLQENARQPCMASASSLEVTA